MLHILWLILKCILIFLGVILGLALLLILLILFCPVRYWAQGYKRDADWKKTEGWARVSWLFSGISVKVYRKDGGNGFAVKVLGIPVLKVAEWFKQKKAAKASRKLNQEESSGSEAEGSEDAEAGAIDAVEEATENASESDELRKHSDVVVEKEIFAVEEPVKSSVEESAEAEAESADAPGNEKKAENAGSESVGNSNGIDTSDESAEEIFEEASEKALGDDWMETQNQSEKEKKGLFQRISEKLTQIRVKFNNIKTKFHNTKETIDWWKKFYHHSRTQAAISLVWKYAKGLLRHILPTKVWGNLTFGFEDPSLTGRALGLLGMSFPLHKNCIAVTPRFDGENMLEGEINLKGRIYGFVLLKAAIVIYFNKNVKYVLKRAKHGKHKEG